MRAHADEQEGAVWLIELGNKLIGTIHSPRCEDSFWESYVLVPEEGSELKLDDDGFWDRDDLVFRRAKDEACTVQNVICRWSQLDQRLIVRGLPQD